MNNAFTDSIKKVENTAYGENNRKAYKSTHKHLLDFFYCAGSLRKSFAAGKRSLFKKGNRTFIANRVSNEVSFENSGAYTKALNLFFNAFDEDPILAVATLFWLRDIRGGAGERQIFRSIYKAALEEPRTKAAVLSCANLIPEYGRWDDLWNCLNPFNSQYQDILGFLITKAQQDPTTAQLIAKWLPRERGKKAVLARQLANITSQTIKSYRVVNSRLSTNTVETQMSAKEWDDILFERVPSVAMSRYVKAFNRNAKNAFMNYKEKLVKGEAKINASVVFPYEVIKSLRFSKDNALATAQWESLPNYIPKDMTIMPIVDVSGSMASVSIGNGVTALDVAVSLGMYCAERQTGPFKSLFMTFSRSPQFVNLARLGRSLLSKLVGMERSDWAMNTDIDAAMRLILATAKKANATQKELPQVLLILSDMNFDQANTYWRGNKGVNNTYLEDTKELFSRNGYKMPHVVFWNLNGATGHVPALHDMENISMVSGFSPTIMQTILAGEEYTPMDTLLNTVASKRYLPVIIAVQKILGE